MSSTDTSPIRQQIRVAARISGELGVLLHRLEGDSYWALPGGRVEPGEAAADALVREMREELDEPVQCGTLLWVVENFFSLGGQRYHEVGLYFDVTLDPASRLLCSEGPFWGREGTQRLEFAWFGAEARSQMDIRPAFVAEALGKPAHAFLHAVHRDGG